MDAQIYCSLETTHIQSMGIHRNEVVHNATSGQKQNARKLHLQGGIDTEMARYMCTYVRWYEYEGAHLFYFLFGERNDDLRILPMRSSDLAILSRVPTYQPLD